MSSQGTHSEGRAGGSKDSYGAHTPPAILRNTNVGTDISVPCAPASVVLLNVWNGPFSVFAALNLPTCHWLGSSRALKPRRRASSAALVDEPGSDGPWVDCTLRTLCPRHSIKSSGSAATQQGGRWATSTALREEPRSSSLARGRPQFIHPLHSQRKRLSLLDS